MPGSYEAGSFLNVLCCVLAVEVVRCRMAEMRRAGLCKMMSWKEQSTANDVFAAESASMGSLSEPSSYQLVEIRLSPKRSNSIQFNTQGKSVVFPQAP